MDISFIIPNRGGSNINFVIQKIKDCFGSLYEINFYVISQDDNEPFKRGQLFNIAHKYATGKYLCFMDNDTFFEKGFNIIDVYEKLGCIGLQPFTLVKQVSISSNGHYKVNSEEVKNKYGKGAITFIKKDAFEKINGYSNLYIGYGCEDTDFDRRCGGLKDINAAICHITHPRRNADKHWDVNKKISGTSNKRDTNLDSYKQTTCKIKSIMAEKDITKISVSDIGISDDFQYKDILKWHEI